MCSNLGEANSITKQLPYRWGTRHYLLMTMAAIQLLFLCVTVAVRGQSALDGFNPNADNQVYVATVQPDGKILIGGRFTTLSPNGGGPITRNYMARLNPDGTLDAAFNPNANGEVHVIVLQPDGKILVGGYFTNIGGQPRNHIARLNPTTGAADSFDPDASDPVTSIAVQVDGNVIAGGWFKTIGGQPRNYIARLNATTGVPDSFDPNAFGEVFSLAVQQDGKILVGGTFSRIGGQPRSSIARLDPTTGLADSFNPNGEFFVLSILVQPDGKILVGGFFGMARLDPATGAPDSFDSQANGSVDSLALQGDGKILVCGSFTTIGGQPRNGIARLDPSSASADSFDPNAAGTNSSVYSIATQADGKILAVGSFRTLAPNGGPTVTRNRIARLETDGGLDQTLDLSTVGGLVLATAVQPDGKILIGGGFSNVLGVARNNLARLNANGTLDTAFNPNASSLVRSIAVQTDGKILVGGDFIGANSIGGQTRNRIARLDPTTGLADSFDPNPSAEVLSIALQPNGKILASGQFTSIGGQARNFIARLDPTTGLADSFDPHANDFVVSIAVQADGKVLAGGLFNGPNSIGGQTRNRIARLDGTTGLADSFDPNASDGVISIAVQADGKILAGGNFNGANSIGGQTRNHIARLHATSGSADSFDPNADGSVSTIALQADGKILAGGLFNSIGGQTRNRIARLEAMMCSADSFDPNANGNVFSIALQADGKILAGGDFTTIGGQLRNLFARLSNDTAALQNLAATQTTVSWTRSGSSPQFRRVTFEYSTDNLNYTPLGNGTPAGSNWTLTGLNFSTGVNFYLRARGYYRSGNLNGSESIAESVRYDFVPTPGFLANIATRMRVDTGNNVLIGGFIVTGNAPKKVVVRGIGPSLAQFGLGDLLADPTLELRDSNGGSMPNDDWQDNLAQATQLTALHLAPNDPKESALVATLQPGGYTAILAGKNNGTGVGLVEIYDVDAAADSQLANISTRGFVLTNDNVMFGGFILGGDSNTRVVVRGRGPSLAQLGLNPVLADPTLELHDSNGVTLVANDDWQDDPASASQLSLLGLAPSDPKEPAIFKSLPAGAFTAVLAGKDGGTGIALVEIYNVQ
jgi:uncharacterized delta-60 repeat protein